MDKPILFFDGVCSLCNGFVDFIFKYDLKEKFLVSSLQGKKASEVLPKSLVTDLNTIVLYKDGKSIQKSTAVLLVLKELSFPWNLATLFLLIPAFIRDFFYMRVSVNRYLMFGKKSSCRLPTASERSRFLD
ncbi:MAG: putative DCC family thiol-disulfide oxidoreductase YuxK [Bacteriovoracaceae bacterium]|jgi:predicted DCC family thiol-disulfide oxidoreductase YuxK